LILFQLRMQTKQFEIFYDILLPFELCKSQARIFWGGVRGGGGGGGGGVRTPQKLFAPPRGIWHRPQKFLHPPPANYIYFDLIVSYLIILTTKFVKANIMVSDLAMQA
jgi:hypothetical protein